MSFVDLVAVYVLLVSEQTAISLVEHTVHGLSLTLLDGQKVLQLVCMTSCIR